ncbi:MAG: hypothetical protein Q9181_001486 [Wetmoreana brouardii]
MRTLLPPPPPSSPEYSATLASLAARILYPNPLPSSTTGSPLYILNSAAFPSTQDTNYDDLAPYVLARLPSSETLIAGLEYEIFFFAAPAEGKEHKKNRPGWHWYLQIYQLLPRVLRKRLRRLWIVGAENWIRILVEGALAVGGGKGRKKVLFLRSWRGLRDYGVAIEKVCVPPMAWEAAKRKTKKPASCGQEESKAGRRAFGVQGPLPVVRGDSSDGNEVRLPRVLREATSFLLMEECVKTKGVFRVNAKAVQVELLRDCYERGQQFVIWKEMDAVLSFPCWREGVGDVGVEELEEKDGFDVHAAAGLIKLWYNELREPICPPPCYQALKKFYGDKELELEPWQLVELLKPDAGWTFLSATARRILNMHLLPLLSRVTKFKEWNQMSADSLAVCFAPALLRGPDIEEDMKIMDIIRRLLGLMVANWEAHLAPVLGLSYEKFEKELHLPKAIDDREDPLEEGDQATLPMDAQMNGITLVDNDGSASDTAPEEGDDRHAHHEDEPPPLPPRPRTFADTEGQRPPLPPRIRSSTITDVLSTGLMSGPRQSPNDGFDGQVRRKPAPTMQPLPRYSMVVGSSNQAPATLEHMPFYNTGDQPIEEPDDAMAEMDLPEYEPVPGSSSRTVISRKPVPQTSPKGES